MKLGLTESNKKGKLTKEQAKSIFRSLRDVDRVDMHLIITKELVLGNRPYQYYMRLLTSSELRTLDCNWVGV